MKLRLIILLLFLSTYGFAQNVNSDKTLYTSKQYEAGDFLIKDTSLNISRLTLKAFLSVRGHALHIGSVNGIDSLVVDLLTSFGGGSGTISSLNGLTGATQTFATGTAGTNFGISSSGTVHTFNLPTASASNRGLLSTTDWSIFNGKQDAITPAALTKVDDANVTLTLGGPASTALLNAASLTLGWNGLLSVARGGTGIGTLASNGILYGNGTSAIQALAVNSTATHKFLQQFSSGAPLWSQVALSTDITGILPGLNGGTENGFMKFIGPATSLKTYSLPNVNCGILTTSTPVTVSQGGTGVTTLPLDAVLTGNTTGNINGYGGYTWDGTNLANSGIQDFYVISGGHFIIASAPDHNDGHFELSDFGGIKLGDYQGNLHNMYLWVNDQEEFVSILTQDFSAGGIFHVIQNELYMGDWEGLYSKTYFHYSESDQSINMTSGTDYNSLLKVDDGKVSMGDWRSDVHGYSFIVDDRNSRIDMQGNFYLNGNMLSGVYQASTIDTTYLGGVSNVTVGAGLSVTTQGKTKYLVNTNSGLVAGTTAITSGGDNRILTDSAGILRENVNFKYNTGGGLLISPTNSGSSAITLTGASSQSQYMMIMKNSGGTDGLFLNVNSSGTGLITAVNQVPTDPSGSVVSAGANFGYNASANNFYGSGLGAAISGKYPIWFQTGASNGGGFQWYTGGATLKMSLLTAGLLGVGVTTPTAFIHPAAGTTATASLNIPAGSALSTKVDGAIYRTATDLFLDSATTEYVIFHGLKGSATLDFGSTLTLQSTDLTITVTGAVVNDPVVLGIANASVNANTTYTAWVSAANTVTVRFNNYSVGTVDPASGTFKVSIIR